MQRKHIHWYDNNVINLSVDNTITLYNVHTCTASESKFKNSSIRLTCTCTSIASLGDGVYKPMMLDNNVTVSTTNLYEPHMASYGLTDIEDVGILVQNNQKAINSLEREST